MKRLLSFIVFISVISGCNLIDNSNKKGLVEDSIFTDTGLVPFKYEEKFKVGNRTSFRLKYNDIDSLDLIRIDSLQFLELLQTDELNDYNNDSYTHYFYSFQSPQSKFQGVTIIFNSEYDFKLLYLIYSKQGKLLSKFEVAGFGGDGPNFHESFGYFLRDTVYRRTLIDQEFYGDTLELIRADTVKLQIYFNSAGKLLYQ